MDCVLSGSLLVVFSLFCYAVCFFRANKLSLSLSLYSRIADLYLLVGVEEHDADEGQDFLGGTVAGSGQVRQRLDHRPHVVQLHLYAADQQHLPAVTSGLSNTT